MSAAEAAVGEWRERVLAAAGRGAPLRLRGAGTKDFYGESLAGELLELSAHRGILSYEPSELVIRVRCGTPLSEIQRELARAGQFLAFEPPLFGGDPTIGGVIAAGLSGPRRVYAGAARDFVLGARLLDARGELLRFGGEVMKNVAGFDVSRLLCGSLGVLGIITEVSLKVLPLPRAEATLQLQLPAAAAVETFNRLAGEPLPLSAAAWSAGVAWLRLSGAAPAVRAARARIGGELIEEATASAWWQGLRDCTLPFFAAPSLWRLSLPSTAAALTLGPEPLIDWGGAVRWYAAIAPGVDVRAQACAAGGTALHWRGAAPGQRFHPLAASSLELHRRLKARFDPQGIFNRDRLMAGM
jgi:glycolate oxidase FAD binding subunit